MKWMVLASLLGLAVAGCEEENIQVGRGVAPTAPPPPGAPPVAAEEADAGTQPTVYRDEDFSESDTNRDPFRSFEEMFVVEPPELDRGGRDVTMPETAIEEMRLIGVVTGFATPRAMIIDREGVGHSVRRGDYIGRSEVVQVGGTEQLPVTLNWRVDRIRDSEIVLIREDPTAPNRPPLTRVLTLREDGETGSSRGGMSVVSGGNGMGTRQAPADNRSPLDRALDARRREQQNSGRLDLGAAPPSRYSIH